MTMCDFGYFGMDYARLLRLADGRPTTVHSCAMAADQHRIEIAHRALP